MLVCGQSNGACRKTELNSALQAAQAGGVTPQRGHQAQGGCLELGESLESCHRKKSAFEK